MDGFQVGEFVVLDVHGDGEEKSGIPSVYDFVAIVFNKICVFLVSGCHQPMDLAFDAGLFRFGCRGRSRGRRIRWWNVPF